MDILLFILTWVSGFLTLIVADTIWISSLYGVLFGFVLYACYDLTNYTFFKNYSKRFLIIKIIWRSILGSLIVSVNFFIKIYIRGVL